MGGRSSIPIIDIFAGPGGLGEGFRALRDRCGKNAFRIALLIETDEVACRTLQTRAVGRYLEISGKLTSLIDDALGTALSVPASADRDADTQRDCASAEIEPAPAESLPFPLRTCGTRSRKRQIHAGPDAVWTSISPSHPTSCPA